MSARSSPSPTRSWRCWPARAWARGWRCAQTRRCCGGATRQVGPALRCCQSGRRLRGLPGTGLPCGAEHCCMLGAAHQDVLRSVRAERAEDVCWRAAGFQEAARGPRRQQVLRPGPAWLSMWACPCAPPWPVPLPRRHVGPGHRRQGGVAHAHLVLPQPHAHRAAAGHLGGGHRGQPHAGVQRGEEAAPTLVESARDSAAPGCTQRAACMPVNQPSLPACAPRDHRPPIPPPHPAPPHITLTTPPPPPTHPTTPRTSWPSSRWPSSWGR